MLPERYTWGNFRRATLNPRMFVDEARRTAHKHVSSRNFRRKYGTGLDIIDEDWDTLIVLDACRCDAFDGVPGFEGTLSRAVSCASTSIEFFRKTFAGKTFHDTVYVSANPKIERLPDETFHFVKKTYGDVERDQQGRAPEHVCDVALDAAMEFPDKRLVIHFMQPHTPYVGPKAADIRKRLEADHNVRFEKISQLQDEDVSDDATVLPSLLIAARNGYISDETLREVYDENLDVVLESVTRLQQEIDGKTVVTADHGEMLGDNSSMLLPHRYGHRPNAYNRELRLVPWVELDYDTRREATTAEPRGSDSVDETVVQQQLEALGYVD